MIARLLQQALASHRAGALPEAERLYREILSIDQRHSDAWHLLGVLAHQVGQVEKAVELLEQAVALAPSNSIYLSNLGEIYRSLGRFDRARDVLEESLRLQPGNPGALNNLGLVLDEWGRPREAVAAFRASLVGDPRSAEAWLNLGNALHGLGCRDEALASVREALALSPELAVAHNSLGILLKESGELDAAEAAFRRATELNPGLFEAQTNWALLLLARGDERAAEARCRRLIEVAPQVAVGYATLATVLHQRGELSAAEAAARDALRLAPNDFRTHHQLAIILRDQSRPDAAKVACKNALELNPQAAKVHNTLGTLWLEERSVAAARECFERAIAWQPTLVEAQMNLADTCALEGKHLEARTLFLRAYQERPQPVLRLKAALVQAVIAPGGESLEAKFAPLRATMTELSQAGLTIADPAGEVGQAPFQWAYSRDDVKPVLLELAAFYRRVAPSLSFTMPATSLGSGSGSRLRVGVISRYFGEHTIGLLNAGWIRGLNRQRFEVTLFRFGPAVDALGRQMDGSADRVVILPIRLDRARWQISAERLDVLIYTDIGMEAATYFLAFSRLAPVQCTMWGHPVTTGIDTIDYFLSGTDLEPADADEHYSEQLVRLPGLPTYYDRPPSVVPARRDELGWSNDWNIYLCPQSLFKLQPDFDAVLLAVLRADCRGRLVLLEGEQAHWRELLLRRLAEQAPEVISRISFQPRRPRRQFLSLLAAADVILDPLHFSGGNTTFEALSVGTPIVTLAGQFMRGRVTAACYRRMGLIDAVATTTDDYIQRAVRLGTDSAWRQTLRERIRAASPALYEDASMVRGLEDFLVDAVDRVRREGRDGGHCTS